MDNSKQRIKIAVQKTGRLTDHSLDLLERCGLKFTQSKDQLFCYGENMPIDLLLVRDDDIPGLVADDICDLGIVGLNVVEEKRLGRVFEGRAALFDRVYDLDFGHCRLSIAAPDETPYTGLESLENCVIATSYVSLLRDFLDRNGITARIEYFSGAVEIAPKLGKADFICDLVSTGSTLVANGLSEREVLLESEAVIIQTRPSPTTSSNSSTGSCSASTACCRSTRANTSCCTRRARPWTRYAGCCRAARRRPSFRWRAPMTRSPCMPSAGKTCSGRRSRT